jgi:hypothetical protein
MRVNDSDLLKRHATAHVDGRRHHKSHLSRPGRVSQACKACAQAKLKCKEEKPCQRCETKGIRCEFNEAESKNAGSWGEGSSVNEEAPQREIRTKTAYDMNQRNENSQNLNEGEVMDYMPPNNQALGDWTPRNAKHVTEHNDGMMGDSRAPKDYDVSLLILFRYVYVAADGRSRIYCCVIRMRRKHVG